jgi:hypothetical protein
MKTKLLSTMIIMLFIGVFSVSCSKDSTGDPIDNITSSELSFVVNGDVYQNQTFKFDKEGMAIFDAAMNATGCEFTDAADNSVLLAVEGNTSGSYAVNDSDNSMVVNYDDNTTIIALTEGTITITKYGNVNDMITGTFTGSGMVSHNYNEPVAITIKDGKFSVKRVL